MWLTANEIAANSVTKVRKFTSSRSTSEKTPHHLPKALIDHCGMALAGRDAETDHHFLNEVTGRQEQQ